MARTRLAETLNGVGVARACGAISDEEVSRAKGQIRDSRRLTSGLRFVENLPRVTEGMSQLRALQCRASGKML